MEQRHKDILRKHRLFLSEELLVSETVVQFLFQEEVLTATQVETIEAQETNRSKVLKLLDLLPSRGPRAFELFLRSLQDFSWVRDTLQTDLDALPGPGLGSKDDDLSDLVLRRVPSDRELSRVASVLGPQWEAVLLDLGLSAEDVFRCRSDHQLDAHGAALEGLVQWRRAQGRRATVGRLRESLEAVDIHPSVLHGALC